MANWLCHRNRLWVVVLTITALSIAGCGGDGKGKDASPTVQTPSANTVEVTALAVSFDSQEKAIGSAHPVSITVKPVESGGGRVGFFEEEVGGSGPQWEAAGWTGVSVASLLLGIDPRRYEFSFSVGGAIDGPSAGGLMTAGVLAAILGEEIRPDVAMTGTIGPDGSIGPVGGIPHKIEGAAEQDKALVLVPGGQRYDFNENTHELEDVTAVGERLGVEVKLVNTIYEAYEELTGSPLPRPKGEAAAELPPKAFDKLRAQATEWIGRYNEAVGHVKSLPEAFQAAYEEELLLADELAARAGSALTEGLAAVALERASSAARIAEEALQDATRLAFYLDDNRDGMLGQLDSLAAVGQKLVATLDRLEAETPRSATDVLALIDSYSNVAVAQGAFVEGANWEEKARGESEFARFNIYAGIAAKNYVAAGFFLDAAEGNLEYELGFGKASPPSEGAVQAIAEIMRKSADANLAFFNTVIAGSLAETTGRDLDDAKSCLAVADSDYDVAVKATGSVAYFDRELTAEPQRSIAVLGSALSAWATSNLVVTKYYALGASVDCEQFVTTAFTRERALTDTLDLADERAKEMLRLVGEEGPVPALYYHENAIAYREEGDDLGKAHALFYNWQAAALSEMLAYFNGQFDQAISEEPVGESPLWRWGAASALDE